MNLRVVSLTLVMLLVPLTGCGKERVPEPDVPPDTVTTVTAVITGVKGDEGTMMLALFSSSDGFPGDSTKAFRRIVRASEPDSMIFVIDDVPAGVYAVSVLHDENSDGKMATDILGRPSEGFGFSHDARGFMGPPGFDKAAFQVAGEPVTIRFELSY